MLATEERKGDILGAVLRMSELGGEEGHFGLWQRGRVSVYAQNGGLLLVQPELEFWVADQGLKAVLAEVLEIESHFDKLLAVVKHERSFVLKVR